MTYKMLVSKLYSRQQTMSVETEKRKNPGQQQQVNTSGEEEGFFVYYYDKIDWSIQ